MSKGILIYSDRVIGDQIKVMPDFVPFSKNTTEYDNSLSYIENMEDMIYDILEKGFVFINEATAIPIFNIKAFKATDDQQNGQGNQNVQKNNHPQKDGKKWKPITHNKKMHRRMGHQGQGQGNSPIVPVKPEEILKQNVLPLSTNDIGEIC